MNSFLSTSKCREAASCFAGDDRNAAVLFQIKVNDVGNIERLKVFADIKSVAHFPQEEEVLFGMSSVFQITNVYLDATSWVIEMELTNCKEDEEVQKFLLDIKRHLYRISTKRRPFNILKKLLMVDANTHPKPLIELMKFILTDLVQIFIVNVYKKNGQLKNIITKEPKLRTIVTESNSDLTRPSEACIGLLCDALDDFLCGYNDNSEQENDISISILCFGGFLLIIGHNEKCIHYFQIILRNESVDKKLKIIINSFLNACYQVNNEQELSIKHFYESLQSSASTFTEPWYSALIASLQMAIHSSNQTLENLQPSTYQEQNSSDIPEQWRLLHFGQLCLEQQKPVDVLNYWEEALEINSSLPSSVLTIFNGMIYALMASASIRLDNKREALLFIEKATDSVKKHYPSSHRIFATLHFMHGCYLLQNKRAAEAIEYLQNALNNIHFSKNQQFRGTVFIFSAIGALQCGNINKAKEYCEEARKCSLSTFMSSLANYILQAIPNLQFLLESTNLEEFRQIACFGLQYGQQIFSSMNSNGFIEPINEETSTSDKLISLADFYRHRQEYANADKYYRKAIEKMTDSNETIWIVFRKMIRMNFIESISLNNIQNMILIISSI
jgi:tetratricopeptide (TPR) repeat protein